MGEAFSPVNVLEQGAQTAPQELDVTQLVPERLVCVRRECDISAAARSPAATRSSRAIAY